MATKPSTLPRWANVGGDIVVPSSGKQDVGWAAEERPPNSYMNWLQNLAYQWFDYLNDGDLTGLYTFADGIEVATDFNHTFEYDLHIHAAAGHATGSWGYNLTKQAWDGSPVSASDYVVFSLPLKVDDRLKEVHAYIQDTSGAATLTFKVFKLEPSTGVVTQLGSTQTSAGSGGRQTLSVTGLTETVSTQLLVGEVNVNSVGATHEVYGLKAVYDRP